MDTETLPLELTNIIDHFAAIHTHWDHISHKAVKAIEVAQKEMIAKGGNRADERSFEALRRLLELSMNSAHAAEDVIEAISKLHMAENAATSAHQNAHRHLANKLAATSESGIPTDAQIAAAAETLALTLHSCTEKN